MDDQFHLKGLITIRHPEDDGLPRHAKDAHGRLLVGAAIGAGANTMERAEALVAAAPT